MKISIDHLNRIRKARFILGKNKKLVHIQAYQCSIEKCGHEDSIILSSRFRNKEFVPVCVSLEELEKSVKELNNLSDDSILEKLLHKKIK